MSGTVLTINLTNLTHNYTYLRSKLAPHVKMLGVVKAVSYGSDAIQISRHLQSLGIDYLAVAYAEEGVALRENGITLPILVLHPQPHNFELIIAHQLEPSLYSVRVLELFSVTANKLEAKNYPVHIKFNSGLNRLGFLNNDIATILKFAQKNNLYIKSIFSHLAASEDIDEKEFTDQQIEQFAQFAARLQAQLLHEPLLHQSNTSGILNYPNAHFSMVRTGIGLYGYGNDAKYDKNLKPVTSLTSVISQIHKIQKGDSLGYNRGFIAKNNTRTATIALGHADGIGRIYGNGKGFVIINDQKAYILGNVCMDMIMVDVTNIVCNEGDQVIVFNNEYSASALAEAAGTISYELITGIGARVKRIITEK